MESLVLQSGNKSNRHNERVTSYGNAITVGRAYANDLVLADPYIAAQQLQIERVGEQWQATILDHTNPVLLNGEPVLTASVALNRDDKITVGRSVLCVIDPNASIERPRKLLLSRWLYAGSVGFLLPSVLLVLVSLFDSYVDYIQLAVDLEWKQYAYSALVSVLMVSFWAGTWALIGHVLRSQHHFWLQLLLATLVFILAVVLTPISGFIEFGLSSELAGAIVVRVVAFLLIALLLKLTLFLATNIHRTSLLAVAISGSMFAFLYASESFLADDFSVSPSYSASLKAPFSPKSKAVSMTDYFAELKPRFDDIDQELDESD